MAGSARRPARAVRPVRTRAPWYDSPWRIAGHAVSAALTIAVVALIVALVVVPKATGGASLTVLTGSMEPTLMPGDVVVIKGVSAEQVCSDVSIGTIVTYLPTPNDPALITHRVVGKTIGTFDDGTSCRLITQGDNNSAVDEPVSPEQVRGVFLYGIPQLGWARQWAGGNIQILLMVGAAALVAYGLWTSMRKPKVRVLNAAGITVGSDGSRIDPAGMPAGGPLDATMPVASQDPAQGVFDRELRARELDLREREIELRARELELAWRRAGVPTDNTGNDDTANELGGIVAPHSSSAHYPSEA
jgi:signal peptidase I